MMLLRRYQLDIIFLFFALMILLWTIFYSLQRLGADPHKYEWYAAAPLLFIYFIFLWQIREKINRHERRALTGETLCYWIAFGSILFFSYAAPLPAKDYWSFEVLFIMFTIFLADSYWDFKRISLESLKGLKGLEGWRHGPLSFSSLSGLFSLLL